MSIAPAEIHGHTRSAGFDCLSAATRTESMEPTTDHDLMLAVRDGDTGRLGDLFERHHRALYGFFVRVTGQRSSSEDLVQVVFYRILKYRHTYRDEGSFTTWMYHLARKVLADHFRKSSRAPVPLDEADEAHEARDETPHAAHQAERNDELALLRTALARMPGDQRELITLYRLQHLPLEQLAQIHACSVGTLKVRIHRALRALRDHYLKLQAGPRPYSSDGARD
ncbi:RNA polymerase sigma factor SigX [mine drainage metagenome]|uniref:RNA polymerase sigma factor SigX n=1 Tax=mine drainage metagenome TaxID=410659 RepID=A0A1J5T285_9ZZZZ